MAERIIPKNYRDMINALQRFASQVYTSTSEMQTLASVCVQAIGSEDEAVAPIYKQIKACQLKYLRAAKQALAIAKAMEEELKEQEAEKKIWDSDE